MGYSFAAFSRLYTLHHTPYTLMVYRLWAITCLALRAQVALACNLPIEDIVIKSTLLSPAIRVALYSLLDA